jgi:drug/metabolite transporter (DMT)-like permease
MKEGDSGSLLSGSVIVTTAAVGWGTWPLFLHAAERDGRIPPAIEGAAAMLVLTLAAGATMLRDRIPARASSVDWAKMVLIGLTDALNVVFFFAAYQRTSVAIAVLSHYMTPMLVALAAPLVLGERWRARTLLALAVSFAGLVLLLSPWSAERHAEDFIGAGFGLASAVCYTTTVVVSKSLVPSFSGSETVFFHGVLSVVILLALVPWGTAHVTANGAAWLTAGSLLPGATSGLLFVWGLRRVRASHASILTLFEPLVATMLGSLVLGQPLGVLGAVGGALILAGAAMAMATGG